MKTARTLRDKIHVLLASAAALAVATGEAHANGKTIGDASQAILNQVKQVGTLTIAGAFLMGIIMLTGGLLKLKQASENQGQNPPYSAGLWRLALGAGLLALPALGEMLTASAQLDSSKMTNTQGF